MDISEELKKELNEIKERNKRVEIEKAWERSFFRRFLLTIFTYLSIAIYLAVIKVEKPWLNAIVPAMAFVLSTLTMPFFRKVWLKITKK
jgi:hypothetical protein